MSYYYNYYAGYYKDGKIYPLGPFDDKGKLHSIISRSRSFASDLHEDFHRMKDAEISEQLKAAFCDEEWEGTPDIRTLPFAELPSGDFVKKAYVQIEQVREYEKDPDDFDGFYDILTPIIYAAKLEQEIKFGKSPVLKNEYGEEYHEPNASEYMFYAWADYNSIEYEAFIIRQFIESLRGYKIDDKDLLILETEG